MKDEASKKIKNERLQYKITLLILVFALIFICSFATYAFFYAPNSGKNEEVGLTSGTMSLTFSDGDNGINKQLEFNSTVTKIFTIQNTGTVTSSLSLDWDNLVNTYLDESLTFKLSYSETEGGEKKEILPSANVPTSTTPLTQNLASELSVPAGKTYYYYLDITLNNTDFDQTSDLKANFSTKFNVGLPTKYRYYRLSIDPNGGTWNTFTSAQEYQLQNNETLEVPNPTKVGHTFTGWNIEGTSSTIENNTFTMGIEETTLTANYTKNKYTVSINIDGNIQTEEVEYLGTINIPENPTKEGYTFTNYSVTGGTLNGNTLTVTEPSNITVTANFVINNYKYIVYHNKQNIGGSGYTRVDSDTDEGEAEYNSEITPGTKSYTGFETPPVQSLTIKAETTYPPVLNKVEYNYTRNKHTLTLNLDGGSSTTTGKEMYYEETKELIPPTKTGYNFTNWTTTSGSIGDNTFTMGDSDATITANYTPKTFTVTYNANGGTPANQTKTVTYDSKYILPETNPTREGYGFLGWFTESSGGTQVTADTTVSLNDNQTLYAQWKETLIPVLAGLKANPANITDYNSGNKGEMFTFTHPEAEQTTGWSEEERTDYRYIGANPNNYIKFNDETWRIIGVFTVENEVGVKEQRIKIIREASIEHCPWDTKSDGTYINEWPTSSLATMLNGDYVNSGGSFTQGLNSIAKSQITPVKWYLGGSTTYQNLGGPDYYSFERGTTTCVTTGKCSGQTRSTNLVANVGLMYPSDYVYTYSNGVDNTCYTDGYNCDTGVKTNGWLYNSLSTSTEWLISPNASDSNGAFRRYSLGYVDNDYVASSAVASRPVVYLRSDIQITGGDGASAETAYQIG